MKTDSPMADIRSLKRVPVLLVDLDGTIRYSSNGTFINHPDEVKLYDGVEEKLWGFRDAGYLIAAVSNQGGVAFGYKTPEGNRSELARMVELFDRNPFHFIKTCYHHPDGTVWPYNVRSLLRKPDIGMLALIEVSAFEDGYVIDWDRSLFVGDRDEDYQCAKRAGVPFQWAWEFRGDDPPDNWQPPDPDQGEGYYGGQGQ